MGMHAMYDREPAPTQPTLGMFRVRFVDPETGERESYDYSYTTLAGTGTCPGSQAYAKACANNAARYTLHLAGIAFTIEHVVFPPRQKSLQWFDKLSSMDYS